MRKKERFSKAVIIPNIDKPGIAGMVEELSELLEKNGVEFFMLPEDREALGLDIPEVEKKKLPGDSSLAVVLGGDGTILHAVDALWGKDVPILGINIGKLGFLTTTEMHEARDALSQVFAGRYKISERTPIGCRLSSGGETRDLRALNEIVIGKLVRERLIHLSTYINGEFFMRYSGDGLIMSSATGSTAYSLSSGGPIVTPELDCFLLTPICSHMLFSRPMVLHPDDRVKVVVEKRPELLALSIDGREEVDVPRESTIEFFLLERIVGIVELEGSSFYKTLREKFLIPPRHLESE